MAYGLQTRPTTEGKHTKKLGVERYATAILVGTLKPTYRIHLNPQRIGVPAFFLIVHIPKLLIRHVGADIQMLEERERRAQRNVVLYAITHFAQGAFGKQIRFLSGDGVANIAAPSNADALVPTLWANGHLTPEGINRTHVERHLRQLHAHRRIAGLQRVAQRCRQAEWRTGPILGVRHARRGGVLHGLTHAGGVILRIVRRRDIYAGRERRCGVSFCILRMHPIEAERRIFGVIGWSLFAGNVL